MSEYHKEEKKYVPQERPYSPQEHIRICNIKPKQDIVQESIDIHVDLDKKFEQEQIEEERKKEKTPTS